MALSHSRGKINSERGVVRHGVAWRGGVTLSGGRSPCACAWTEANSLADGRIQVSGQPSDRAHTNENESPAGHILGRGRRAIEFPPSTRRRIYVYTHICMLMCTCIHVCVYVYVYAAQRWHCARCYHLLKRR